MEPYRFPESNRTLTPNDDPRCNKSLRVYTDGDVVISAWKLSFWDRLKVMFTGLVWVRQLSGGTQYPMRLDVEYPFEGRPAPATAVSKSGVLN